MLGTYHSEHLRWHIYPHFYPNKLVFVTQRHNGVMSQQKKNTKGTFPLDFLFSEYYESPPSFIEI